MKSRDIAFLSLREAIAVLSTARCGPTSYLHAACDCKFKSNSTVAICKMTWISRCLKSHYWLAWNWLFFQRQQRLLYFCPFDFIFALTTKYNFNLSLLHLSICPCSVLSGLRNIMWASAFDGKSTHDSGVVTSLDSVYSATFDEAVWSSVSKSSSVLVRASMLPTDNDGSVSLSLCGPFEFNSLCFCS